MFAALHLRASRSTNQFLIPKTGCDREAGRVSAADHQVYDFYAKYFLPQTPPDMEVVSVAGCRQYEIHWDRVGKPENYLIDQPSLADGPRHRHLVDARVRYHCGDGLIGAVRGELCAQMLVPNVI
jgi:hypothetical protein